MIKSDHRVGQNLKNKLLFGRWQITSIKTTTFCFRREIEVSLSHLFEVVKPLLTFLSVVQPCVWSVVLALVLYGMGTAGRMNCWQTHAVLVLAAVRVSWNSVTWCEASFAPLTCELLNETKRKKRFVIYITTLRKIQLQIVINSCYTATDAPLLLYTVSNTL